MKKLTFLAALVCSLNSYASDELTPAAVFQGSYSGVSVDYKTAAPIYIDGTKNAYYEASAVYLSGDSNGLEFDHLLLGLSYGVSDKLNEKFDWFGQAGVAYVSNESAFTLLDSRGTYEESGVELIAKAGVASSLNDKLDYKAYVTIKDDTALGLSATFKQSKQLQFVGSFETFSNTRLSFGINYQF